MTNDVQTQVKWDLIFVVTIAVIQNSELIAQKELNRPEKIRKISKRYEWTLFKISDQSVTNTWLHNFFQQIHIISNLNQYLL